MKKQNKLYKRILITGSNGVLGGAFKDLKEDFRLRKFTFLTSKDCDLTKLSQVLKCVKGIKPDAIIHLAAKSGGVQYSSRHQGTLLRDNVLMAINVLEVARVLSIKKVIMTLSSGMYPENAPVPIKEEYIHEGNPHPSNYGYSFAKRLIDPLIRSYRDEFGINVIGVIPNGILGEHNNYKYDESVMIPALIRRFYENKDNQEELVVWGDGSPLREYTYAKDVVRAIMWCLDNYDDPQVLNIGSTEENSVRDTALKIAKLLNIDKKRIIFDKSKPSGQYKKSTENEKFRKLSRFKYTPFAKALKLTIEYFARNYPNPKMLKL